MADDIITQMVNDPDFGKLSPVEQRKALAAHDPIFAKVNDDEISKFITAHQTAKQNANVPSGTTAENMSAVEAENKRNSPYPLASPVALPGVDPSLVKNISGSRPLTPEEQAGENTIFKQAIPMMAATAASEGAATLPLLARMGITAGAGGLTSAAVGGDTGDIAKNTALGPAAELVGAGAGKVGDYLSNVSSQALARILRLSPKAFQFGREPAQEVLERGLASGNLEKTANSIGEASKQVTSELTDMLKKSPGTVDVFTAGTEASKSIPNAAAANRFEQVVLDAADKLGLKNLGSLSNAEANALKQEVARQARFVEGDLRPSVASAAKIFGGKVKDGIVANVPEAGDLLQSSANLTEASKGADYAVRAEKAGQGKSALSAVDIKKPSTYPRLLTDTPTGASTLFRMANMLKEHVGISAALRTAFQMIYPTETGQ